MLDVYQYLTGNIDGSSYDVGQMESMSLKPVRIDRAALERMDISAPVTGLKIQNPDVLYTRLGATLSDINWPSIWSLKTKS